MQSDKSIPEAERQVVETSLHPAHPLISNQPERFGALSEAFLFVEEKRLYELFARAKWYAILSAVLLAIPIVIHVAIRVSSHEPLNGIAMDVLKIIFSYLMIGSIGALVGIFVYRRKIMEILNQLEDLAYFGDDMARFYMPYLRSELREFNERMNRHKQDPTIPTSLEIVRDLWPVVSMLLKRDPNILNWGKVGFKVYKTVSAFFKGQNSNSQEHEPT